MTGPVYARELEKRGLERLIPDEAVRERLNAAIFDELCQGIFNPRTTDLFVRAFDDLKSRGAECFILGCTEISLIIEASNSSLPVLDSTRLLAAHSVARSTHHRRRRVAGGALTRARCHAAQSLLYYWCS